LSADLIQAILEIVFKGNMLYLAPILLILFATIFAERLIELISTAFEGRTERRFR